MSTVIVFTVLVGTFAALAFLVGPAAVRQAREFGEQLPDTLAQLERLPVVGGRLRDAEAATRIQEWIEALPGKLDMERVSDGAAALAAGLINAVGVLLIAFVATLDGPGLVRRAQPLIPDEHKDAVNAVGTAFARVVGTYFAGSLLVATIAGTWVLTVCLVLAIPLAPIAAVWYAVTSLIPQVGGFLGVSFVALLAFTTSPLKALLAIGLVVAYMNLENYVISPAIVGKSVDLSPPTTMLAAIIGGAAMGVPGALVGTPLCGTVKALYLHFRHGEPLPERQPPIKERLPGPIKKLLRIDDVPERS